jgi:hypothetical protein
VTRNVLPVPAPRLAADRDAVNAFIVTARGVAPERWAEPRAPGKWSPAQVVEHIALAYESNLQLLRGPVPGGAPRWLRPLIRKVLLGYVLRRGSFPRGSRAPKILKPDASPAAGPASELIPRLEMAAGAFEAIAPAHPSDKLEHPFFGEVPVADMVRLMELHTRHHTPQLLPAPPD